MAPARRKSTPGASAGSKKNGQLGKANSSIVSNGSSQPDADKPDHRDVVDELACNQEVNTAEETPSTSNTAKSKGKRTKKQLWEYKLVKPIEEFKPVIIDEDPAPDAEFNNRGRVRRSCMQRATQNIAALNIVNPFRQIKSRPTSTNKKQTTNVPDQQSPSSSCRVSTPSPSAADLNEPNNKMMEVISPSMAKDTVTAITAVLPEDLCLNLDSTLCHKLSLSANEVKDENAAVVVESPAEIKPEDCFGSAAAEYMEQEAVEEQHRLPPRRCSRLSSNMPNSTVTSTQKRPSAAANKKGKGSSAAAQLPPPSSNLQNKQRDSEKSTPATSRSNKSKPMEVDAEDEPTNNSITPALFPFFPNGFDPEEEEDDCEEDIAELTYASSHLGIRDKDDEAGSTIAQINTSTSTVDSDKEQVPVKKETKKDAASKTTAPAKKHATTKKKPVANKKSGAKSPAPKNTQVSSSRRQVLKLRKKALATTAASKPKKASAKPKKAVATKVENKAAGKKGAALITTKDEESSEAASQNTPEEVETSVVPVVAAEPLPPPPPAPPTPQFTYLDECIILWKSTQKRDADSIRCICEPTKEEKKNGQGCGEDCLNRQLYMECGPGCPSGKYCTNKRFQKRLYADVEVFYTGAKGFGLKVNTPIKKGQFIIEYVGEVCDYDEMVDRMKRYSKDPSHKHHYFMALSGGVIDATAKGNNSRFINHSCDPNSKTLKWNVNKQERIGFFAIKPIGAGEEITFNYQFERFGKRAQKCYCGSSNCTGYIGARNEDDDEEEDDDEGVESDYDEQSTSNTSSDGEEPEETIESVANKEKEDEVPVAVVEESLKSPVYQSPEKVPPALIEPIESVEQPVEVTKPKIVKTKEPKKPKTPRAPKKHTQPRKKKNNGIEMKKTYELAEVMEILNRGPMRNKEHVVEFNRLMVRVELTESREKMVEYLLKTEDKDIQRLFVANQGLALIRLWFTVPHEGEVIDWKLHNNIAKVLLKLPLVNKNQVLDTNIFAAVEQLFGYELPDEIVVEDLMKEVVNKVADFTENNDDDVQSLHIPNPMIVELASLKATLKLIISSWSKLSQFKIPKKDINVVASAGSFDHSSKNKEAPRRHYHSSFASNKFPRRDSEDRYLNRRRPLNDLGSDWKDDGAETGHSPFSNNSFNNPNSHRNGRKSSFSNNRFSGLPLASNRYHHATERSPPEAGPCIQRSVDQSLMNPSISIPPSPHPTGNGYPQYEGAPLGYASAPSPYDPQYAGYMPFNPAGFMPSPMPMAPYFMGAHMVASPHFYPGAYMPHAGFPPPPPPRNSAAQAMPQKPVDGGMTPEEWLKIVMANASAVATQANANLKAPDAAATTTPAAAVNDQSDKELSDVEREVVPKNEVDSKKEQSKHKSGRDSSSKKNRHSSSKRSSSMSHGRKSRSSKSKHRSSSRSSSSSSSSSFSSNSSKDGKRKRHSGSSSKHRHSSRFKSISLKKHWSASKSGDKKGSSSGGRHSSNHINSNYKHGLSASNSLLKKSLRMQQHKHDGRERSSKKHSSSSRRHSRHRSPRQEGGRRKDKKKHKRRSSKSKSFSSSSTSCSSLGLPAAPVESESVADATSTTTVALRSPLVVEVEDKVVAVEEQMADKNMSKKPASRFGQPFKLEEKKTIKMIINTKATDMLDNTSSSSSSLPPPQLIIPQLADPTLKNAAVEEIKVEAEHQQPEVELHCTSLQSSSFKPLEVSTAPKKIDGRAPIQMVIKPFGFASKVAKARLTKLASPPLPPTLELDDLLQAKTGKAAEQEVCSPSVRPICTTPVLPQAARQELVQTSSPVNPPGSPPVDVQQPPVLHPYLLAKASSLDSYISALYQYIHTLEEFREGVYGSIPQKESNNLTVDVQPATQPQEETAACAAEGDKRFLSTFSPIKRRHAPEVEHNKELPEKKRKPTEVCLTGSSSSSSSATTTTPPDDPIVKATTTTNIPINNPDVDNALTLAANYMSQNLPKSGEPYTPRSFTSDPRLLRGQVKAGPSRVVKQPVVTATAEGNIASEAAQPAQTQVECVEKPVGKSGMWFEVKDPQGSIYYYHRETRQSAWVLPPEEQTTPPKAKVEKPATTTPVVAAPKDTPASTAARANFKQEIVSFAEKYMKPYRKRFFSSGVEFAHFLRKITKKVIESQDKCSNRQLDFNEGVQSSIKRLLEDYIRLFNKQHVLPTPPSKQAAQQQQQAAI